jgi:mannose/cellobiose epimerase-like protein (N-acyl-D-glucosamine 2-epimerase family)
MNFYQKDFLLKHSQGILNFYDDIVIDPTGGYFQNYYDDGTLFSPELKQLVSSTRIVVNYALAAKVLNNEKYFTYAQHGLDFIEQVHWREESQSYAWVLRDNQPDDMTQQAYGYAFVLLAYAAARKVGIINCDDKLILLYDLLEKRFFQSEYGLYADTIEASGELNIYRGQNANMHLCEAMLAAYDATKLPQFLNRAELIAKNICQRQAALSEGEVKGLIWEHFTQDFQIDWQYNQEDPKNLYRPWGFQPGHQTEWTKLLLQLNQYAPAAWLVEKAEFLFNQAYSKAWDHVYGGLIYGFDPNGECCDDDKYFWVQAESFAAAAALYRVTNKKEYLQQYQALWAYSWEHFVDHQHGAWYRVLKVNNEKYSNEKSTAGAKCDYHTLGACFSVLNNFS